MSAPGPPDVTGDADAARWTETKRLLDGALARHGAARSDWLARTCPDGALAAEVAALAAAHDAADASGAVESAWGAPETVSRTGETVGAWRLGEALGAGGMGEVYAARRADDAFEQEAAVKLVRGAGAGLRQRFLAERQLLARLDHRGIARLLDGGLAPDGTPFLAMERVRGTPITAWAERHGLDVEARLRLFLDACDAVAYAHRHLVVHRDLKPGHILVDGADGAPRVVLLDFGIARLLDASPGEALTVDRAPLTPAWAAPEQLRPALGPVTTATDVYGLGLVLYELLAGRRAFVLDGRGAAEAERAVCETDPLAPSRVAPAARRRRLRGDLDTVTLRALAREPARRYESAAALADDLRRHLDGLPVLARPATAGYRAGRFVRRHRTAVVAAAAVVVAVAALVGFYTARLRAERDAADRRFAVARDAARAMIYDVHDAVAGLPGATAARAVVSARSLDFLDRLADEAGGDPSLRLDLAEAYVRVGNAQGNPTNHNLGQTADARASYRRGLAVLPAPATPARGDTVGVRVETVRGRLYEKLGVVEAYRGRVGRALALIDRAVAAHRRALAAAPDSVGPRVFLATSLINRGDYTGHPQFPNAGRPAEALGRYQRARALLEAIPEGRRTLFALRMLGVVHEREGALLLERGDADGALAAFRASAAVRGATARRLDATADVLRDAAIAREKLGDVYRRRGRLSLAGAEYRVALAGYRRLAAADTADAFSRETLAVGHLLLARLHGGPSAPNLGDRAVGRQHYRAALALLRPLAGRDAANARTHALVDEAERDLRALD